MCSQKAVPSSLGLTAEIAEKMTCEAENGLVSTSNSIAGIDAIYRFTETASVQPKSFLIGGVVGLVAVATSGTTTATQNRCSMS